MSRYPKIGIRVPACAATGEVISLARRAEELGFDTVAFPDSQMIWRELWTLLGAVASQTRRITLATEVTNTLTRDVTVVASAIRTLSELAPGRVRIGLGVGNSAVALSGLAERQTSAALRDSLVTLRAFLGTGSAVVGGRSIELHDPPGPVPIYVAAEGPKNTRIAAEFADGMIISSLSSRTDRYAEVRNTIDTLGAASGCTGRRGLVMGQVAMVTDTLARDCTFVKAGLASVAQMSGTGWFESAGYDVQLPGAHANLASDDASAGGTVRRLVVGATDLGHSRDAARVSASEWIPDDLAEWFARNHALIGSAEEILKRLARIADGGVDEVTLSHGDSFSLPLELIEAFGKEVLPRLC